MISQKFKQLAAAQAKVTRLQNEVNRELAKLPKQFGFPDADSFIAAIRAATNGGTPRRGRPPGNAAATSPSNDAKPRRRRSKITPEMKQQLKKMVGDGKTGAEVAKELGISLPSVANIKKEMGLSKARKK
jgi:DNA-binding NarL/FixJ family response regulator